ncbi:MAG TPA: phosphoribosylamine--glycine ligase [Syntrophomonadaceae bacterium]|nr:phosphoribosylamine--glycine ligase [Syntrophomonadaceae bacterium]
MMAKKVLVIGQGGREHALVWKLAQSPEVGKIYAAPGNPGIAQLADCIPIAVNDVDALLEFALREQVDLTVVGPEAPLMEGLVDRFQAAGLTAFGPSAAAARLEGSKVFTKELLKKYNIPTAAFEVFDDIERARAFVRGFTDRGRPVVVKADGLAAGKGVVVAATWEEADEALENIMVHRQFGAAGQQVVVEECLQGEEVSFFVITDGKDFLPLIAAQDHKRVYDNDQGPNTGGMGAYVNPPVFTPQLQEEVINKIIRPVIEAMISEGCPYQGVLYAGLMITAEGPQVLEFNARFGDPETQALMPMIEGDLFTLFQAASGVGRLEKCQVQCREGGCVCVVLASGGYPGTYEKEKVIAGLDGLGQDTLVFHAGTAIKDDHLVTDGGRVLAVVCRGEDIGQAIARVYQEVGKISFAGMHYRKDIGGRALKQEV